jgi:Leucine-rich repeat (LRR) protein
MKYSLFIILAACLLFSGCGISGQQNQTNVSSTGTGNNGSESNTIPKNKKLDLSNQNLTKVPDSVFNQTNLEELNLSSNQLTGAIQAEIRHLQNLKVLNLSNNILTGVPAEVGQLQNLQILDLSNNQLTGLPYELGNLKNLKTLNISGNNYSSLDLSIIKEKLPANVQIIK